MKLTYQIIIKKFYQLGLILFIIIGLISCAKTEVITDLDFQKNLLAGSGGFNNTFREWKVDSMTDNGVVQNVSLNITVYKFYRDGTLERSDGYRGNWQLPSLKDLTIKMSGITKTIITNKYQIVELNTAQLRLKYDSASKKQDIILKIYTNNK